MQTYFPTDLDVKSACNERVNVTVIPDECCLVIEKGDVECEVSIWDWRHWSFLT